MTIKFNELKAVDIGYETQAKYLRLMQRLGSNGDPRGKGSELTPQEAVLEVAKERYGYTGTVAEVEGYLNGLDNETSQNILREANARLELAGVFATGTVDVYVDDKKAPVYAWRDKGTGTFRQVRDRAYDLTVSRPDLSVGEVLGLLRYELSSQLTPSESKHEYLMATAYSTATTAGTIIITPFAALAGAIVLGGVGYAVGNAPGGAIGVVVGLVGGGLGGGALFYYGMWNAVGIKDARDIHNNHGNLFIKTIPTDGGQ